MDRVISKEAGFPMVEELPYTLMELAPRVAEIKHYMTANVKPSKRPKITDSKMSFKLLQPLFEAEMEMREKMVVLILDRANKVICHKLISIGGVSGTICDPKILFKAILDAQGSGFILAHNHPSGNTQPSQSDIDLTKKCKEAGRFLEIQLLDHIIMTSEKYYSFADEGMI